MLLKTIIIDDEPMALKSMEILSKKSTNIELLEVFDDPTVALHYLESNPVDLILLDMDMPKMTGIELLEKLSVIPHVIVTTGNTDYAYEAYEFDVTDFLKKPIIPAKFNGAVEKVIARDIRINAIAHTSAENEIYIKTDGRYIRLPYDEILYFENVGDYIKVITNIGTHVIYGALKAIDEKLKHPRFLKVHRSYIVNLDKIKDIEENTLVIEKKVIPISRAHKPTLLKSINII